jgi:signal transduction histidine kinase
MKDDIKRIETLNKYDILDTPPEGTFDSIVKLASKLLDVPIAMVSLVDTDRIWFKSAFGLNIQQIPREGGLCSSAILSDEFYMIEDALTDTRTMNHSLVIGESGWLRFYAGVPLTTSDGYNLGTLCVLDRKPRTLTDSEQIILVDLAAIVMQHLELRLMARLAVSSQNRMAYMITHDIRSAVCNIPTLIEMIKDAKENPQEVEDLLEMINYAADKSLVAVDSFLTSNKSMSKEIVYHFKPFNLSEIVEKVILTNEVLASRKQQKITFSIEHNIQFNGDKTRLIELVNNLVTNAIKYSPKGKNIEVILQQKNHEVILKIIDEGQGMTQQDINDAFKRFSKLSAKPTNDGEVSTGLGLWICKEITEKHEGHILVESEGKDKGTTFTVLFYRDSKCFVK